MRFVVQRKTGNTWFTLSDGDGEVHDYKKAAIARVAMIRHAEPGYDYRVIRINGKRAVYTYSRKKMSQK